MLIGALGDVHGDTASLRRIFQRHADVPFWLCVGDLGGDEGQYWEPPAPLYWIKGNNEDFDFVARQAGRTPLARRLPLIPNGRAVEVGPARVAGLGGTFAPTWYETPPEQLPHPAAAHAGPPAARRPSQRAADKRRHFVRAEVAACEGLRDVDIFLSHEAPKPFFVSFGSRGGRGRGMDAGKPAINAILRAMRPRLHLFGHHHRFVESEREGVRSVCLDLVAESYLLLDWPGLELHRYRTSDGGEGEL